MRLQPKQARPLPAPDETYGRVRRFKKGDRVVLTHGVWEPTSHIVLEAICDPTQGLEAYGGGTGNSARYRLSGKPAGTWWYDWQLEADCTDPLQSTLNRLFIWLLKPLRR